jgi:hypothetical protein
MRNLAETKSHGCRSRAPLTTLDAQRILNPLTSTHREVRPGKQLRSAVLLPKDRCNCQRSHPSPDLRAIKTLRRREVAPHCCGAKELVPEGTGNGTRSDQTRHRPASRKTTEVAFN